MKDHISAVPIICDSCASHSHLYLTEDKDFPMKLCEVCMHEQYAVGPSYVGYLIKERGGDDVTTERP